MTCGGTLIYHGIDKLIGISLSLGSGSNPTSTMKEVRKAETTVLLAAIVTTNLSKGSNEKARKVFSDDFETPNIQGFHSAPAMPVRSY